MSRPRARVRLVHLGIAALAALASIGCQQREEAPRQPSIILTMVDTLRADYLGTYGFSGPISPHLDALASESIVFERCVSQAPWTKPAIASLFTGLEPTVHQVLTHKGDFGDADARSRGGAETDVLPPGAVTLAEALGDAGYETAAFVANPWIRTAFGFAQGFDHFDERHTGNDTPADVVLAAARAWLDARDGERPFFLYLHLMDVHGPYDAPPEDVAAVRGSADLETDVTLEMSSLPPGLLRSMQALGLSWVREPAVRQLQEWRTRYAAGVRAFDRRFHPFVEHLRRTGALDRAVLVVTSDHGEELYEHGDWVHGKNLHYHQLNIPLLVRMPEGAHGGRRVDAMTALVDVLPTLVHLAGAEPPSGIHGVNLSPWLGDETPAAASRELYATGVKWKPGEHSLQTEGFKLIKDVESGEASLFEIAADPREQDDLAASRPLALLPLDETLERHLADALRHPGIGRAEAAIDPEVEERLRALGYLE